MFLFACSSASMVRKIFLSLDNSNRSSKVDLGITNSSHIEISSTVRAFKSKIGEFTAKDGMNEVRLLTGLTAHGIFLHKNAA